MHHTNQGAQSSCLLQKRKGFRCIINIKVSQVISYVLDMVVDLFATVKFPAGRHIRRPPKNIALLKIAV